MKVVVISSSYPSKKKRVSGTFVKKLIDGLALNKLCEIMVFSPKRFPRNLFSHQGLDAETENISVYFPRFIMLRSISLLSGSLSRIFIKAVAKSIAKQVKKSGFSADVIYAHFAVPNGLIAQHVSFILGAPYVVNLGESSFNGIPPKMLSDVSSCLFNADKVLAVSSHVKRNIQEVVGSEVMVDVVHNGVDSFIFHKQDKKKCRELLGLKQTDFIIAYTGSLIVRKGFVNLLSAMRELQDDVALICATGSECVVDERIALCRTFKQEELPIFLSAADVFVFPSINEGMPNAVLEAASVGLPIILVERPFNEEILSPSDAYYIQDNTPASIYGAISELRSNDQLRENLAGRAKIKSKGFTLSKRVDRIHQKLLEVL